MASSSSKSRKSLRKRILDDDDSAIKFEEFILHKFPEGSNKIFIPLDQYPINDIQKCILDNLWAATTVKQKLLSLNCLTVYFSKQSKIYGLDDNSLLNPSEIYNLDDNRFLKSHDYGFHGLDGNSLIESSQIQNESSQIQPYYVIFKGHRTGVFNNYSTVIKMTTDYKGAMVKVYDSLASALQIALLELGSNFEIEPEPKRKTDNPIFLDRDDEMEALIQENINLKAILFEEQAKNEYQWETIQNQQQEINTLNQRAEANECIIKISEDNVASQEKEIATLEETLFQNQTEAEEKENILREYENQIQGGSVRQNRTFRQLAARLKRPGYALPTLKPLFSFCPDLEPVIRKKASNSFYDMLSKAQSELVNLHFLSINNMQYQDTYEIRQIINTEWEVSGEEPYDTGIFSLSIDLDNTEIPASKIQKYYELGMVHHMKVSNPRKIYWFGDKLEMVANLLIKQEEAADGIIHIHCINRLPRNYEGFSEEPAQHRITISNRYLEEEVQQRTKPCQCFITIEEPLFYETLGEKYIGGPYGSHFNFHEFFQLYTEGHYTQIYGPKYQMVGWFFPLQSDEYAAQEVINDIQGDNANIREEDDDADISFGSHSPRSF